MKDSKTYEKKLKKLLSSARAVKPQVYQTDEELVELVLLSILEEDTSGKKADKALANIKKEFVDYNEMRVARTKEIEHCIGVNYIEVSRKARQAITVFNNIFKKFGSITLQPLCDLNKRDQKSILQELGMSLYVSSVVALKAWSHHAIPVDWSLVGYLELNGCIEPGTGIDNLQKFLERIFNAREDLKIHEATRALLDDNSVQINKWRKEKLEELEAIEIAEAERLAREEAERLAREEDDEFSDGDELEDITEIADEDEDFDEDLLDDLGAEVVADIDDEEEAETPAKAVEGEEKPKEGEPAPAKDEAVETSGKKARKPSKKSARKPAKKTSKKSASKNPPKKRKK